MVAWTADRLNGHLSANGTVYISTMTRATAYKRRHAGWFTEKEGVLYVQHGKGRNCLGPTAQPYVGITLR